MLLPTTVAKLMLQAKLPQRSLPLFLSLLFLTLFSTVTSLKRAPPAVFPWLATVLQRFCASPKPLALRLNQADLLPGLLHFLVPSISLRLFEWYGASENRLEECSVGVRRGRTVRAHQRPQMVRFLCPARRQLHRRRCLVLSPW